MEIEDCDPLDDGIDDDLFGLTKGLVKFFCPNEFLLWAKQRFELCHNLTETIVMSVILRGTGNSLIALMNFSTGLILSSVIRKPAKVASFDAPPVFL